MAKYVLQDKTIRIPCEVEITQCLDRPNQTTAPSIHCRIGNVCLGHVFFDDRYDDGRFWIADNGKHRPPRFVSQKEAVDFVCHRLELECPAGFLDVCEKV